jgi:hypothetical protein
MGAGGKMSHQRESPDLRNKGRRDVVNILLRPAMLDTLHQMHSNTTGVSAGLPFETFLAEILESVAAEHRSRLWRAAHPVAEPEADQEHEGANF